MDIDIKQAGGDASEATLAEIRDLLEKQKDFNESIWIDATDTYCIRRIVFDEDLQTYTVSFTLPDGTSYSPTLPIEPASSGADREIVTQTYLAIGSGTGYSAGDIVTLSTIYDTNTATVLASIWWNTSTDTVISPAPALGNLEPEGITQNIAAAVGTVSDAAYTSGSGTLVSILKGIFGKFGTLGQKNMAGSAPVVIASDQSTLPISAASLPLPTGAATQTTLAAVSTATGAQADAAYTTGSGSIISILKGIFTRLIPYEIVPAATQTSCQFTVAAAVTSGNNSASTATTPSAGVRYVSITNNSGIVVDLTTGGTSGGADGTTIITAIAGDSFTVPFAITNGVVLRIKPTSGNLTSSDYVQVRCS